jgi:hypothetical protein
LEEGPRRDAAVSPSVLEDLCGDRRIARVAPLDECRKIEPQLCRAGESTRCAGELLELERSTGCRHEDPLRAVTYADERDCAEDRDLRRDHSVVLAVSTPQIGDHHAVLGERGSDALEELPRRELAWDLVVREGVQDDQVVAVGSG